MYAWSKQDSFGPEHRSPVTSVSKRRPIRIICTKIDIDAPLTLGRWFASAELWPLSQVMIPHWQWSSMSPFHLQAIISGVEGHYMAYSTQFCHEFNATIRPNVLFYFALGTFSICSVCLYTTSENTNIPLIWQPDIRKIGTLTWKQLLDINSSFCVGTTRECSPSALILLIYMTSRILWIKARARYSCAQYHCIPDVVGKATKVNQHKKRIRLGYWRICILRRPIPLHSAENGYS